MNTQLVVFNNKNLKVVGKDNQFWLSSSDIANALDYSGSNSITNLYNAHKEEFSEEMTEVIESMTSKNMCRRQRFFNREGAWLIGMFARTPKAAEFRKWVLKVLGVVADSANIAQTGKSVVVAEHTRSLPTGKKEIVLSEKAKQEIGGIIKAVVHKTLTEFMANPDKTENWELSDGDIIYYLHNWHCTRNKADILKMRALVEENEQLKRRLAAIKQAIN